MDENGNAGQLGAESSDVDSGAVQHGLIGMVRGVDVHIQQSGSVLTTARGGAEVNQSASVAMVSGGDTLKVGDLAVTVIATPGHTPGDLSYDIDGSLFCGDLLFRGSVGRTDFPGGDFDQLLASVARLTESPCFCAFRIALLTSLR